MHFLIVTRKNNTRKFTQKHFQATLKPVVTITEGICQFIYIHSKKNLQMTLQMVLFCLELNFFQVHVLSVLIQKCKGDRLSKGWGFQSTLVVCKTLTAHRKQQENTSECNKKLSALSASLTYVNISVRYTSIGNGERERQTTDQKRKLQFVNYWLNQWRNL